MSSVKSQGLKATFCFICFKAENIYNDEEPDTPASELEQQAS